MDTSVGVSAIKMFQKVIYASYILIFLTLPGKPELHRIFFNMSRFDNLYFRYHRPEAGRSSIELIWTLKSQLFHRIMFFMLFIKISSTNFIFSISVFMFTTTQLTKSFILLICHHFFIIYWFFIMFNAF